MAFVAGVAPVADLLRTASVPLSCLPSGECCDHDLVGKRTYVQYTGEPVRDFSDGVIPYVLILAFGIRRIRLKASAAETALVSTLARPLCIVA